MTDVKELRCIQQQLSMTESAPVCQHWSYASDHAMKAMLRGKYFLSAFDRLRPGDTIRIVQMKDKNIHARDNSVVAFSNVTVLRSGKVNIDMHIDRMVELDGAPVMENAEAEIGKGTVSGNEIDNLKHILSNLQEGNLALGERVQELEKGGSGNLDDTADKKEELSSPELKEGGDPVIKWNPGKKVHEAISGDKVLYSHKNKDEVETWLQKSGLLTAQE